VPPLSSQREDRQGDPRGPFFFALTRLDALKNVQRTFTDEQVVAYANDVHLQGPPPSAIDAFRFLVAATAEIGMSPSLSKCAAYAPSAVSGAATADALGLSPSPCASEALVSASPPPWRLTPPSSQRPAPPRLPCGLRLPPFGLSILRAPFALHLTSLHLTRQWASL
jgi:hypothetical protein